MASLSSVAASSCSLHKHHHQSKHQFSSSSHTALKSTKNFIVSHTSYEQRIDPSLPLCCAINSIQTTVTTNFSYREVFPSAILPTLCCEPDNNSSSDLTAATTEEDDDIFYYYATSDLPGTVGGKELLYREEEGGDNSGSSSHKLDRNHISSPVRSYLLIESMGSGSSTTAAGAAASNRSRSTNVGISASHGNILTKPPKSSKHHIRRSSFSSDNGGFDIIPTPSAASKSSHMGVRERLRSSLDKISFKPAFRWGSSDKIQSNFNNGSSQSKSKNKTSRRSADSPRVRTVAATPEPQSAAIKQQHKHRSRNVESACSELERIGDIMCKSAAAAEQQHNNNHHHQQHISKNGGQQHLLRQHRVTNHHHHQQHHHHNNTTGGGECERGSSNLPDYVGIASSHHTSASNSVANSVMNINKASVDDRKRLAAGNESYQAIAFDYAETLKTNREAITRAKGTWSMLRTNNNPQTRYRPVKASTGVLNPIVISGSMDVLPSSETMHSIASDLRRKRITTEKSSLAAHNTTSPPTKQQDVCTEEPPKIMPVSGKLLQQQYVETTILRPTAFKVVPRRQESPHQAPAQPPAAAVVVAAIHESRSSDVIIMSNDHHSQAHQESRSALSSRKSCASDSNSDSGLLCSGRNSSNSLPAVASASTGVGELVANTSSNTSSGGNVSCSASSEGYDSAGVPHNNNQTEINCADASPLVLHKFANGESLQIHDVDDDDDVELQTANHRHDDGDNTSENDEYTMMTNGNDGKDVVGYHRDSKHVINDKYDDTPHYSNGSSTTQQQQRYNNDPMLPATTIDLTSVIRPSSSEATLHIITQQQHKAQHQHVTLDLRSRLNDYEREMQQRRAEISQLKGQAKDLQGELSHRTTEIVTLRSRNRSLFARVAARDRQLADTMSRLDDREATCSELQRRLHEDDAVSSASLARDRRCHVTSSAWPSERDALLKRLGEVEERYMEQSRQFEVERQQWIVDKTRVVRYQKQLQDNYMHLYKRSRDLEQENNVLANKLRHLTMTSASTSSSSMGGGEKRLMNGVGDVTSSTTTQALSYPMDI